MNDNQKVPDAIGMTILNLEVKDFNWLIEFKQRNALNSRSIPILGIDNVVGCKVGCIYPTLALNLEGMRFGTLNQLTFDVKFNKPINLVDSGRDNLLFRSFARNVVNTGNRTLEKVGRQADSKWLIHFERLSR